MGSNLLVSADIAVSGMKAQSERLRVIAENMANVDSVATRPGEKTYRRQVVTFKDYVDAETGARKVKVSGVQTDNSELEKRYEPNHPGADAQGYVSYPEK